MFEKFPFNAVLFCLYATLFTLLACQENRDSKQSSKSELTYDTSLTEEAEKDLWLAQAQQYAKSYSYGCIFDSENMVKALGIDEDKLTIHCKDFVSKQELVLTPPDVMNGHRIKAIYWRNAVKDGNRLFLITSESAENDSVNVIYFNAIDNTFHLVADKDIGWMFKRYNDTLYLYNNVPPYPEMSLSSITSETVLKNEKYSTGYTSQSVSEADKESGEVSRQVEDTRIYSLSELSVSENPQFPSEGNAGFTHFKLAVMDYVRKRLGGQGERKIYVEFSINTKGETYQIDTSLIHDQELREEVREIFKSLHFIPAKRNGKPINVRTNISM